MATRTKFELKMGMATREAFGKALVELGRENPNIVAVDADLSKSTNTHAFGKEFPERFFSCGIAEANMVALAAGLASAGKIPFAASFSCFVLNKGFEQMRVLLAYPNVNAKIVGTHSGISIGEDGPSQMSVEDLSLACSLPGFTVLSPADEVAMAAHVRLAAAHVGPVFLRAGRAKVPVVYQPDQKFETKAPSDRCSEPTIVATGLMLAEPSPAEHLRGRNLRARDECTRTSRSMRGAHPRSRRNRRDRGCGRASGRCRAGRSCRTGRSGNPPVPDGVRRHPEYVR